MKFCPVVPEICRGQVHVPKKKRRIKKRKRRMGGGYYRILWES
jgi:hypothetical protein